MTLGIYIFNSTRNAWLQEDSMSWGSFHTAREFHEDERDEAESLSEGMAFKTNDVHYVMAAS